MTASTKTAPKQKSQKALSKAEAEELLLKYRNAKARKNEAQEEMKAAEEGLHQYAEQHPDEFEGKTCVMENGKLKWVPKGQVVTPEDFDPERFLHDFPECVNFNLSVSKVKAALNNRVSAKKISKYNLDISYEDQFKVEV